MYLLRLFSKIEHQPTSCSNFIRTRQLNKFGVFFNIKHSEDFQIIFCYNLCRPICINDVFIETLLKYGFTYLDYLYIHGFSVELVLDMLSLLWVLFLLLLLFLLFVVLWLLLLFVLLSLLSLLLVVYIQSNLKIIIYKLTNHSVSSTLLNILILRLCYKYSFYLNMSRLGSQKINYIDFAHFQGGVYVS